MARFDQGGNVGEWNESVVLFSSSRGLRGGWYQANSSLLYAAYQGQANPSYESGLVGFRVATISPDGDFNGNGVVDAADYVVWHKNLGGELHASRLQPLACQFRSGHRTQDRGPLAWTVRMPQSPNRQRW